METTSVRNNQNINLDFNLVEEYEENRSDVEFVDNDDSYQAFKSEGLDYPHVEMDHIKIPLVQSQNDYSPYKNDYYPEYHLERNPYEPMSHREQIY